MADLLGVSIGHGQRNRQVQFQEIGDDQDFHHRPPRPSPCRGRALSLPWCYCLFGNNFDHRPRRSPYIVVWKTAVRRTIPSLLPEPAGSSLACARRIKVPLSLRIQRSGWQDMDRLLPRASRRPFPRADRLLRHVIQPTCTVWGGVSCG